MSDKIARGRQVYVLPAGDPRKGGPRACSICRHSDKPTVRLRDCDEPHEATIDEHDVILCMS